MRSISVVLMATLSLAGCSGTFPSFGGRNAPAAVTPATQVSLPALAAPPPPRGARTADALDTTTAEQRKAATAVAAPGAQASLGRVSVALGAPTTPGFWLKSSLVSETGPGLVKAAGGRTVQVELQPGSGAALLSLAAFRALDLSLTDLPEVEVFRR